MWTIESQLMRVASPRFCRGRARPYPLIMRVTARVTPTICVLYNTLCLNQVADKLTRSSGCILGVASRTPTKLFCDAIFIDTHNLENNIVLDKPKDKIDKSKKEYQKSFKNITLRQLSKINNSVIIKWTNQKHHVSYHIFTLLPQTQTLTEDVKINSSFIPLLRGVQPQGLPLRVWEFK